ncbi:MAG: hypothetical protein ACLRXB_03545 [Escherichia coli]
MTLLLLRDWQNNNWMRCFSPHGRTNPHLGISTGSGYVVISRECAHSGGFALLRG